jgi:hypothetical protein
MPSQAERAAAARGSGPPATTLRKTKRWTCCRLTNRCSRHATKLQRAGASCWVPRAGRPTLQRVGVTARQAAARIRFARLCAEVRGVNVRAGTAIDGRDRKRLERLCCYFARPAISQERLTWLPDGRLH